MAALADLFVMLHTGLLIGFVSVTALLMLVTIANRLRVKHMLMSWRTGRCYGFPVLPTLFIVLVLGFLSYAVMSVQDVQPLLFTGYLVGGVFWFVSVLFSSSVIVTDFGLLSHVGRASRGVAWGQIVDYFEMRRGTAREYVFFFIDEAGVRRRFEVSVPVGQQDRFEEIIAHKLDARFNLSMEEALGNKALER